MRPPHLKAALRDLLSDRLRMMQRSSRMVEQARSSFFLKATSPFVPDPAAHIEPSADRRKRLLALLNRHHKTHPLFHGTGLLPAHRQGPPCRPVDLLPMSPVYPVTYVAGQDRFSSLSPCGRGWMRCAASQTGEGFSPRIDISRRRQTPHPAP